MNFHKYKIGDHNKSSLYNALLKVWKLIEHVDGSYFNFIDSNQPGCIVLPLEAQMNLFILMQ